MRDIGVALAQHGGLAGQTILLGRDAAFGSTAVAVALAQGMARAGVDVLDLGLVTTRHLVHDSQLLEACALLVRARPTGGFTLDRWCDGDPAELDVAAVAALMGSEPEAVAPGTVEQLDTLDDYADHLRRGHDLLALRPLKLVVGAPAPERELLAEVLAGSRVLDTRGRPLAHAMAAEDADLGIELGNGRVVVMERDGTVVHRLDEDGEPDPLLLVLDRAVALCRREAGAGTALVEAMDREGLGQRVWQLPVSDPERLIRAVSAGFEHHQVQRRDLRLAGLGQHRVLLTGQAGPRGPWRIDLASTRGTDRVRVAVSASDLAVEDAVRQDLRAIIESAA